MKILKNFVKSIPGSRYVYFPIAKVVYSFITLLYLASGKAILMIYTMGKVGTVSLSRSIKKPKRQAHYILNKKSFFEWNRNDYKSSSISIYKWIYIRIFRRSNVKIITAFRDPYSRNISLLFQTLHHYLYHINPGNIDDDNFSSSSELLDYYFKQHIRKDGPFTWFKDELEAASSIDIFDYPFDKERGYSIIKKDKISILVLTLEKLNDNEGVIADFIGEKDFKLDHKNNGTKKWYADLYDAFKKRNLLSEQDLSYYYDNEIVRHFYTETQIEEFKNRWRQK
jgi:hypothetical protein